MGKSQNNEKIKRIEDSVNSSKSLLKNVEVGIDSKLSKLNDDHKNDLEKIENQIQESTFIQAEKVQAEIEPLAKSFETKISTLQNANVESLEGMKNQIIIENNRHFESIKSEVSSTMMSVTEKNNTVEKHVQIFKENNDKVKEELENLLSSAQKENQSKLKQMKEENSSIVERVQNLENSDSIQNEILGKIQKQQ